MQADTISLQQIEQQLNRQFIQDPRLKCEKGQIIDRMCLNPQCASALFCHSCKHCQDDHYPCDTVELKYITEVLNKRVQDHKNFILKMVQIDNKLIAQVKKSQRDLAKRYHFQDLAIENQAMVNKIYRRKNMPISGLNCKQFQLAIRDLNKGSEERANLVLDQYRKYMEDLTEKAVNLKLQMPGADKFDHSPLLDSVVLNKTKKGMFEKIKFMMKSLGQPKDFKLLFRASDHNFSGQAFHEKCDNIEDTVTLIHTEFNKTIAAYSKYKWNQMGSGWGVEDEKRKAFILQLQMKRKFLSISDQNLVFNKDKCGPVFGSGHDLFIANHCDRNKNSCANIQTTYYIDGIHPKKGKPEDISFEFSGEKNFKVEEYEVYKVIFDGMKRKYSEESCQIQ